jgi:hypothetical protein
MITITRPRLAALLAVVVLGVPATAVATHVFTDVPDARFYAGPVDWASANDITTGSPAGSDTFRPDDPVTRGEAVTFLKRYHDNITQPRIAALEAEVAALEASLPFAVTAHEGALTDLTSATTEYVSVSVTAPADGHVTVNSTAYVLHSMDAGDVRCLITESTAIPASISSIDESSQHHESGATATQGTLSGTRTFAITAGATVDYVLVCREIGDGGSIVARNLTAIYTPAPPT